MKKKKNEKINLLKFNSYLQKKMEVNKQTSLFYQKNKLRNHKFKRLCSEKSIVDNLINNIIKHFVIKIS
jgi:hypothetical protein